MENFQSRPKSSFKEPSFGNNGLCGEDWVTKMPRMILLAKPNDQSLLNLMVGILAYGIEITRMTTYLRKIWPNLVDGQLGV